ncbi:hypothetical protein Tco_0414319 [Tanacetum coccineum]
MVNFVNDGTCISVGSGLSKGLCLICASRYGNNPNPNSLNDSPNISKNVSQSPPLIDHHCCYECEEPLDGLFCQQYGNSFTYDSTPNFVNDSPNVFNPPSQPPTYSCEFCGNDAHYGYDCPPQVLFSIIRNREDGELEDDVLRKKLSKINLIIAKIEALKDNPTLSSDFVTKSPSTSPNSSPGGGPAFLIILYPNYEAFFCDSEPDSSDFTMDSFVIKSPIPVEDGDSFLEKFETTPKLETFKFDIEEKNSGSTTIHADISLSDLECFYFKSEPDPGDLTSIIDPGIRENVSSTTNVNLPFEDDQSPLFAYVVWIFLPFLTYPVAPLYLLSSGNEDTIFDPGISIYHSFMPGVSHRSGTFMKFNVYPNHLNESPMEILSSTCSPMDQ